MYVCCMCVHVCVCVCCMCVFVHVCVCVGGRKRLCYMTIIACYLSLTQAQFYKHSATAY